MFVSGSNEIDSGYSNESFILQLTFRTLPLYIRAGCSLLLRHPLSTRGGPVSDDKEAS